MTGMEAVEKYFQLEQTDIVWQGGDFLVVHAQEAGFPAFYRLIWKKHVTEFSDLTAEERYRCVDALVVIEQVLREQLQPSKVNVASLGNQTPHLHWHIIARFDWDSHFPGSVWSAPQREADSEKLAELEAHTPALNTEISKRFSALCS